MERNSNNNNCLGFIIIILIIVFSIHAFRGFQNPSNDYSQSVGGFLGLFVEYPSKIMEYNGSKVMKVCKQPYYSDSECYFLLVSSNGEYFTSIHFNNGGYIYIDEVECTELASFYRNSGDDRFFCNAYDLEGNRWDISLTTSNGDVY